MKHVGPILGITVGLLAAILVSWKDIKGCVVGTPTAMILASSKNEKCSANIRKAMEKLAYVREFDVSESDPATLIEKGKLHKTFSNVGPDVNRQVFWDLGLENTKQGCTLKIFYRKVQEYSPLLPENQKGQSEEWEKLGSELLADCECASN